MPETSGRPRKVCTLKFQEGDASNLEGVGNHSFDLTLSVFGAMFAPKPFDVAKSWCESPSPAAGS